MNRRSRRRKNPSLADLLFESNVEALAQSEGAKPVTIVALYGPPAAGKGAAKGAVGEFAGIDAEQNYKKWLKSLGKEAASSFFQEEDDLMVRAMTEELPPLVFKDIAKRVKAGEDFSTIVEEYYHVNETGKYFDLEDVLSPTAFKKIMADNGDDIEVAAQAFASFPNTRAYFTQARGFSKPVPGASEELNSVLGVTTADGKTLGTRVMAAGKYMDDVKQEIRSMGAREIGDTTYASIYLMDQAGESTANIDRIKALGGLKEDPEFPSVTLIGVYIHQPQERTEIANLHRAATGGRRVSSREVERIFAAGPEIEDGKLVKKGSAIEAMEQSGFDQIHVYYPPNPFEPADREEFESRICNPLGPGKGSLDIEGCDGDTDVMSLAGMEARAAKKAGVEDITPDEGLPPSDAMDETQKQKVVQALNDMGFRSTLGDLEEYLSTVSPPGIRGGGEHGRVPWAKELFLEPGRDPSERITVKQESKDSGDLMLERWQRLAGIL